MSRSCLGCGLPCRSTSARVRRAGATQVVRVRYGPCAQGRDVTFYGVQGGGHNWPGGAPVLPAAEAGAVTDAIDASSTIWSFFDAHPLDEGRNRPMVPTGAPGP